MVRSLAFAYGLIAYGVFLATAAYSVGFVADRFVPKGINSGEPGPWGVSLAVDLLLLALFGIQHSVMARPAFKTWWTRIVPAPVERSTYVLVASLLLLLIYWQWRPMPDDLWDLRGGRLEGVLLVLSGLGWSIVAVSTFMTGHTELLGLRQVTLQLRGRDHAPLPLKTTGLYRCVRHPIMLGFLVAFWSTPRMTVGHLVFASGWTVYILLGIRLEERDLARDAGPEYGEYRRRVPMLVPLPPKKD